LSENISERRIVTILIKSLAVGDMEGNFKIYDLNNHNILYTISAHNSEITTMDFIDFDDNLILATGSKDKLIHIFDANLDFILIKTLDVHSLSLI
jgi:WD40 repeat protein